MKKDNDQDDAKPLTVVEMQRGVMPLSIDVKGNTVVDMRTKWQRFKDYFKEKKTLSFQGQKTITHDESKIRLP